MMKNKFSSIIVAAGSGTRMGSNIPKQFLELCGKPLLMHTIEKFAQCNFISEIVVVLPQKYIEMWRELCNTHSFTVNHKIVAGGAERTESVKNALAALDSSSDVVLIHDGVRPLVSSQLIEKVAHQTVSCRAVIPAIKVVDSIREVEGDSNRVVNREKLRAIQTPQGFDTKLLLESYEAASSNFTDDASLLESRGVDIVLVDGEPLNIKVTTPIDMIVAKAVILGE